MPELIRRPHKEPEVIEKAATWSPGGALLPEKNTGSTKALFIDPWVLSTMFSYREPHHGVVMSFDLLKRMAKTSVVSAIIRTRISQISAFASPMRYIESEGSGGLGFKVKLKDKRPEDYTSAESKRAAELEDFILKMGMTPPVRPDGKDKRPGFSSFLKMVVRDSLAFDQACFEKVRSRKGDLVEVWPIDASTIRLANRDDEAAYVQVIMAVPKVAFYYKELGFFVRNPRTDIKANGYGYSELEDMINIITAHLFAENYNQRAFSKGTSAKGILNLKGDIDPDTIKEFRVAWNMMTTGAQNAWRTPVLQAREGVEYINLNATNKEMEFSKWMEYLIKIATATYQIDPSEINFDISRANATGQKPMFETGSEVRLKSSKDKGLRPLLKDIGRMITEEIIEDIDPDWMFIFSGIDSKSEDEIISLKQKESQTYKTVDEIREESGLTAIGEEAGGNLILNPQYIQWVLAKEQAAAMSAAGMSGGGGYPSGTTTTEGE